MQHWQKDRMKLVISGAVFLIALYIINDKTVPVIGLILIILVAIYWGYRWTKGDIGFKNPNKNNP